MRYNIAFKFLAVALCALMLLAALAGGFGILALLEGGLFDKTVAELREEKIQNSGLGFAGQVAAHYADSRLGLWPEELEEPDWLWRGDTDVVSLRSTLLFGMKGMAAYAHHAFRLGHEDEEVSLWFYKGLCALRQEHTIEEWLALITEFGLVNYK